MIAGLVKKLWMLRQATAARDRAKPRITCAPSSSAARARGRDSAIAREPPAQREAERERLAVPAGDHQRADRPRACTRPGCRSPPSRNQSVSIRLRGSAIEDRNSAANISGNTPCTASPEPVRSATKRADRSRSRARSAAPARRSRARPPTPAAMPRRRSRRRRGRSRPGSGRARRRPRAAPTQQRRRAQRRERQAVEEARLDVAGDVRAGAVGGEQRALDERHREHEVR